MDQTLTAALEREHQEIDAGLGAFVDGLDNGELLGAEFNRAADALRRHIYLEEEFLFPPLRAAGMLPPVLVMLREHGAIWRTLQGLELEVGPGTASGTARDRSVWLESCSRCSRATTPRRSRSSTRRVMRSSATRPRLSSTSSSTMAVCRRAGSARRRALAAEDERQVVGMEATVSSLFIYPDSESPAQELDAVEITPTGPEGNRAKKHAVHIVSAEEYVETHPKANIVLDVAPDVLASLVGSVVRLGECTLVVTRKPEQCAGVYADVVEPGAVSVDDRLLVAADE